MIQITLPPSKHIQKATELLEGILSNPSEHQNRVDMRRIMDALSYVGISLGDFLNAYYGQQRHDGAVVDHNPINSGTHQCPSCKANFSTASALSGHGPARCAKKYGKELKL